MSGTDEAVTPSKDEDINTPPSDEEKEFSPIRRNITYTFSGERGWRSYRILRPGRGMYHDLRRRLPYYWSDITDALTYRTVASTVRMYFVK
jgi:boron transporter